MVKFNGAIHPGQYFYVKYSSSPWCISCKYIPTSLHARSSMFVCVGGIAFLFCLFTRVMVGEYDTYHNDRKKEVGEGGGGE